MRLTRILLVAPLFAGAFLVGCASGGSQKVASSESKAPNGCSDEVMTGSLVQKHVVCSSSDDDRTGLEGSMDQMKRPGFGGPSGH